MEEMKKTTTTESWPGSRRLKKIYIYRYNSNKFLEG